MEELQARLADIKHPAPGWTRITNLAAREMARRLRAMCGRSLNPDKADYTFALSMPVDPTYRRWLRMALRQQDFFTKIDNGVGGLPDIREAVLPI